MSRMLRTFLWGGAGAVVLGVIVWSQLDIAHRQRARIALLDLVSSAGLALPERDVRHMQERSGLRDISNVSCRHCHGESLQAMPWANPRPRHPSPAMLAISPDGDRLYATLPDTEEVVEIAQAAGRVLRRTRVPGTPTGLVLDAQSGSLLVTCRSADRLVRLDLATLEERERVAVGMAPVGVACGTAPDGLRVLVANSGSSDVSILALDPLRELARLPAGREPYGVVVLPDGRRGYVANRLAVMPSLDRAPVSELTEIDLVRERVVGRHDLESAHLSEAVAAVPGRDWVLTPIVRVRNLVPITQVARGWVMSGGIALRSDGEEAVVQLPTDEANRYFADPSGLVVDAAGKRAYLLSAGMDVVTVLDLDRVQAWHASADAEARRRAIHDLELAPDYVVARVPTGRNPRHAVLSPDGATLFVAEYLDDSILRVDTAGLRPAGRIRLGDGGTDDPIRRGERLFTWAGQTFQGQFSCRSCHPDGHVDGLNYDFDGDGVGDNLLDNRSLQGVAGTWPYKWNGKNPSLAVQCGPRFAKVLMRTDPFEGPQLEDLTRYLESLPPARTRHADDTVLTEAQERGRQIFFATHRPDGTVIPVDRRCDTCHRPPLYTNRALTRVGTQSRNTFEEVDTPHLLGIGASAPYLHDGRARTLEELWTLYQTNDLHGVSSYMSKQQLNDLVEFLKTL